MEKDTRRTRELLWITVEELLREPPFPDREGDPALDFLSSSVRIHGVLSPVLARRLGAELQIVCGYRRVLAAKAAGLQEVPVVVSELEDVQAIRCYLSENICRRDLSPGTRERALRLLKRLRDNPSSARAAPASARETPGAASRSAGPRTDQAPCRTGQRQREVLEGEFERHGSLGTAPRPDPQPTARSVFRLEYERREAAQELVKGMTRLLDAVRRTRKLDLGRAESVVALLLGLPGPNAPLTADDLYIEEKDAWLAEHSVLCASLNATLAPHDSSPEERGNYAFAGLIHDVGMVFLDRAYLSEPRALSPGQRAEIQSHTRLGFALIHGADPARTRLAEAARDHHERQDGSGYPGRLRGEQISRLSRVTAAVDTYASLVGRRPHRNALAPQVALERLMRATEMGLYDPKVVALLGRVLCAAEDPALVGLVAGP